LRNDERAENNRLPDTAWATETLTQISLYLVQSGVEWARKAKIDPHSAVQRELPREKLELFLGRFRAGVNGLNNNVFQALKLQPFNREDSDRVRDYREGLLAHQQLMHNLAVV
jgi:hypothetical protein